MSETEQRNLITSALSSASSRFIRLLERRTGGALDLGHPEGRCGRWCRNRPDNVFGDLEGDCPSIDYNPEYWAENLMELFSYKELRKWGVMERCVL